ncbi:carbohydrate ABC transporter permease [Brachybacterium sacelli]|uniref:Multiple sugar transport system permease protein n=1 Tax=Brachybacterium sacelli TaxID=173364 RepID=A0ABS4WVY9_9MICO|nr:carbohydrate ABC transporter permease [Brachybacterium sacelli]MBP2380370.1 multiple sugar transport system permease protein [Brachybacterium sacelli]
MTAQLNIVGQNRGSVSLVVRYVVASALALVFLVPFYAMIKTALSTNDEIYSQEFVFWPSDPQWARIPQLLTDPKFLEALQNSAIMAVVSTSLSILIASLAGYALVRIPSRAAKPMFILVIVVLLVPAPTAFVPNFIIVASLGWIGTLQGLIVPGLFSAFNVFLFRQFYVNFPREIEEAAYLDGAGFFRTFFRIVFPNTLPFASALTVLGLIGSWNAFLWPLVVAGDGQNAMTVQIYLSSFLTAQTFDYGGLFMAATISLIPVLLVFFVLQRYLVAGISATGLKG